MYLCRNDFLHLQNVEAILFAPETALSYITITGKNLDVGSSAVVILNGYKTSYEITCLNRYGENKLVMLCRLCYIDVCCSKGYAFSLGLRGLGLKVNFFYWTQCCKWLAIAATFR